MQWRDVVQKILISVTWSTLGLICLSEVTWAAASAASVQGASEQLNTFVAKISAATGQFSQYTVGPQGQTKPKQTGEFSFQRPGRFKWDVLKPYQQMVVSDGKTLFQFDPDLNQVTTRPVSLAIGSSPAAILFGSGDIQHVFEIETLPDRDGLVWLRAKPKSTEAGFVHADLGFVNGLPTRIILLDAFGQTTHVDLFDLKSNPALPPETFQFTAPVGADVVRAQ